MIHEHETEFAGHPVVDFDPEKGIQSPQGAAAHRLAISYDDYDSGTKLDVRLKQFLADPGAAQVEALVIGCWSFESDGNEELVAALAAAASKLPKLRAIFLGDIIGEESEISWIHQSDLSPLLAAYPRLESLRVRGNDGLSFGAIDLPQLKTLIIETGGLSSRVIREVSTAKLPQLTHLELWLGSEQYGFDGTVADLQPILAGELFPKLDYLGLRDCEVADELAAVVATAPIVRRVQTLDLSLGNMTDAGFRALLSLPTDGRLETLILRHHFASPAAVSQLKGHFPFETDASEPQEAHRHGDDVWRFIAVSE